MTDKTPPENDLNIRKRLEEVLKDDRKYKTCYAIVETTDGEVQTILEGSAQDVVLCEKLLQMHTNRVIVSAMQPVPTQ